MNQLRQVRVLGGKIVQYKMEVPYMDISAYMLLILKEHSGPLAGKKIYAI